MKKLFLDSSGVVALVNTRDFNHQKASSILLPITHSKEIQLISTDYVLVEVANACSKIGWRDKAIEFIDNFRVSKECTLIKISDNIFESAFSLYRSHTDKEWGLTDCCSFIVMKEMNISEAFTHDKHFEQAGFTRLIV